MTELTGITGFAWALFGVLWLGIWLMLLSAARLRGSRGQARQQLASLVAGIVLLGSMVLLYPATLVALPALLLGRPAALMVGVGVVLATLAGADWLLARAMPIARTILDRPTGQSPVARRSADAALSMVLVAFVAMCVVGVWGLGQVALVAEPVPALPSPPLLPAPPTPAPVGSGPLAESRSFGLPGQPMDMTMADRASGYISLDDGRILHFTLPADGEGELTLSVVAEGMQHLRGLAIRGDELYVVELGPLPCPPEVLLCKRTSIGAPTPAEGELQFLAAVRATIHALLIATDGSLGAARVVIADLPVVGADHAVNGMAVGPDGRLYVAIGNTETPGGMADLSEFTPNATWLGTILSFDGSDAPPTVFARGLRNVYGIAFDADGRLWAVDNDGPALAGWRHEEVLQVKEGRDYGYPRDGTFGTAQRDDQPVWLMPHVASAGIAASETAGLGRGLLVGSCGQISHLRPLVGGTRPWEERLRPGSVVDLLDGLPGCVTAIAGLGDGQFLATLFRWTQPGELIVVRATPPEP